jgi:hypothetical protein
MAKSLNYCKCSSRNRPYTRRYGARQRFPPFVPIGPSRCGACSGSTPGVRRDMWGDVADREKNRFCTPASSDRTRPIIISCPRPFSRFPFLCAFDTLIVPPRAYVSLRTSASSFQSQRSLLPFELSLFRVSFSSFFPFFSPAFQGSSFSSSRCLPVAF